MRSLEDAIGPASVLVFYASGWLTAHTAVPERWRAHASVVLLALGSAVALAGARALGIELTGGRCRARKKTDGERCSLSRDRGADLCHVHQDVHDVELHVSAIDGTVPAQRDTDNGDERVNSTS